MKTIDIKSNSRILHWAFYIFLFTVLSVGSVYASEDTPSVLSTNQSEKKTVKGNVMDEYGQPLVGVAVQVKGTSLGVVLIWMEILVLVFQLIVVPCYFLIWE
mgnify:CR=1 FL=1